MITNGFEIEGLGEFRKRLANLGDDRKIISVASNAMRRGGRRIVSETIKRQRQRGVLRTIFQKNASGLRKLVRAHKVKRTAMGLELKLTVRGLPAIQEEGGTIRPHAIPHAFGRMGTVQHPGAKHPPIDSWSREIRRGGPLALEEIQKDLAKHFEAAFRG